MLSNENFIQNKNCICGRGTKGMIVSGRERRLYLNVPIKPAQHEIQLAFIKAERLKELPRIPSIKKKKKMAVQFDCIFLLEGKISLPPLL